MEVTVEAPAESPPRVRIVLDETDLAELARGGQLRFDLELGGVGSIRCALARKERAAPPLEGIDRRLLVDGFAFNAVRAGGTVHPVFPDLPFVASLVPAPDMPAPDGPIQVAPGIVYEQVRLGAPRAAGAAPPAPSGTEPFDWKTRAGAALVGLAMLGIAYALRDYQSSLFGFGCLGCTALWLAIRGC